MRQADSDTGTELIAHLRIDVYTDARCNPNRCDGRVVDEFTTEPASLLEAFDSDRDFHCPLRGEVSRPQPGRHRPRRCHDHELGRHSTAIVSGSANSSPAPAAESSSDCSSSFRSTPSSTTTKQRDRPKTGILRHRRTFGVLRRMVPVPRDFGRISGNLHRPNGTTADCAACFYMAALSSIRANGPSRTPFTTANAANDSFLPKPC